MRDGGLVRVAITFAQAQLVRAALAAQAESVARTHYMVSILAAGHVPDGATLAGVEDHALIFGGPDAA